MLAPSMTSVGVGIIGSSWQWLLLGACAHVSIGINLH